MRSTIHEMRNQLTVAVTNIEAFMDGKLLPTPARLSAVLLALHELDVLFDRLRPVNSLPLQAASERETDRALEPDALQPLGTAAPNDFTGNS